eukprot:c17637_g1_i1 orf=615-1640(+)
MASSRCLPSWALRNLSAISRLHRPVSSLDFTTPWNPSRSIYGNGIGGSSGAPFRRHPPKMGTSVGAIATQRRSLIVETTRAQVVMQKLSGSDSGVIEVTLSRPEFRNAIGVDMLTHFQHIFEKVKNDTSARVMLICSSVPGVFCAGADLKERRRMGALEIKKFVTSLRRTFLDLEALSIPTIAVVEGAALGGGLELALSCDLRICGDQAVFGLPETSLAIIPGAGGTQRLPRLIGRSRAKELIFTSRRVDANIAESIGLVNHCVSSGNAYRKALDIAQEIMQQGPLAVRMAKVAIDRGIDLEAGSTVFLEEACYAEVLHSKDRLEGLAAFAEKRKPAYCGE